MDNERRIAGKYGSDRQARGTGSGGAVESNPDGKSVIPSLAHHTVGGAIKGIGEKFNTNPVTGTGSVSIPVSVTPGRAGFGPQLALSYDSGSGNGVFGLGWSISLSSVTRKTDKGIPRYRDADESDVFLMSGAEDLVPVASSERGDYLVSRYRPRTEGSFARIERWTEKNTGKTHWRTVTGNNVTNIYGKTDNSRIADPADEHRVFGWLIEESYDDRGNAIVYEYKAENSDGTADTGICEKNRTDAIRSANRHPKSIRYGNMSPHEPGENLLDRRDWMFEIVFDYGEHDEQLPTTRQVSEWGIRADPFSSYRAGFELRTYRLCRRILMFHHFPPDRLDVADYLVRALNIAYRETPVASFVREIIQAGYVLKDGTYVRKAMPPLEFAYSEATLTDAVETLDPVSLENLPAGLDGARYQWVDLDGEGIAGILCRLDDAWYYKHNLGGGRFGGIEPVASRPSTAGAGSGRQQWMDLAGGGHLDLVQFAGPVSGFFERTADPGWEPFTPFAVLPAIPWDNPNLQFTDLTGDGLGDVLIAEGERLTWYPSRGRAGFDPAETVRLADDEERGPRLIFADGTRAYYLADMSADGMSDLVRIRNGEVCYWPNLGYGRFGGKIAMDGSPVFDAPDHFDQKRIRLVDTDGSGTTDILYLRHDRVDVYRNQSGNNWSKPLSLRHFPPVDDLTSVSAIDLFGNGTGCLVWSSPLPGTGSGQLSFIRLAGDRKPYLLTSVKNNMGAETVVEYAASTEFYLADRAAGTPWVTRLPFPVQVITRVVTYDRISRNRFVTRYKYHHGFYDGTEREFRGFGMVEQTDTEEYAVLASDSRFPDAANLDAASHVPPVLTKTWYHTGAYHERGMVSVRYAREYYREPGASDTGFEAGLLPDTVLPEGLSAEEEREACRALKGTALRQEVYVLDGSPRQGHPYSVTESNYSVRCVQPRGGNRHAVFYVQSRETLACQYERNPADPRISHTMTLETDAYGNVLKSAAIAYGRYTSGLGGAVPPEQATTLVTYTEVSVTDAIDTPENYRIPLPCETRTYELTGLPDPQPRYAFEDLVVDNNGVLRLRDTAEITYEAMPTAGLCQRRLIEQVRTLYRSDLLDGLLALGTAGAKALPGETYKLAFTSGLLSGIYLRKAEDGLPGEDLLPDPGGMLGGEGGYVSGQGYRTLGLFPAIDPDGCWWVPTGRVYYSPDRGDTPDQERTYARTNFYQPHRFSDPFGNVTTVKYDDRALLLRETRDPLGNTVTATELDYRVMQPRVITDPNGNRSAVAFDALGLVVGTALMGKPDDLAGDTLDGFDPDPAEDVIQSLMANPTGTPGVTPGVDPADIADPLVVLAGATACFVYDLFAYYRTREDPEPRPNAALAMARETHVHDLPDRGETRIQFSIAYSDGFGREIQKKAQAEPGKVPVRDPATGKITVAGGEVAMTAGDVSPRWAGSGWTVFNNKGKPVRQFEPFFSDTHRFEFDVRVGVSPIVFYDPMGRAVATLHPNHTYDKVVFDPWRAETWDVNDTLRFPVPGDPTAFLTDPRDDPDVGGFFRRIPAEDCSPCWLERRITGEMGPDEQDAAEKAVAHSGTPSVAHLDALGRTFLTVVDNGSGGKYSTRVELDIEGYSRAIIDALDRPVMSYDYDMLGHPLRQKGMDAGTRWMLNDVAGNPIYGWDSRGHRMRHVYDPLQRQTHLWVRPQGGTETLAEFTLYGEALPAANPAAGGMSPEALNLRGKAYLGLDGAGAIVNCAENPGHVADPYAPAYQAYDFKGNLLRGTRRCAKEYRERPDWGAPVCSLEAAVAAQPDPTVIAPATLAGFLAMLDTLLEEESFEGSTTYDALNRRVTVTLPDGSITYPKYNEAGLLEVVRMKQDATGDVTDFVRGIDYDAKGQRQLIEYGNGVKTQYLYDPLTLRLVNLFTSRGSRFPADCTNAAPCPGAPEGCQRPRTSICGVQNLHYTYDPAGNITSIRDDAQQTVYFSNAIVQPRSDFTYDAVYRLIRASGREHIGSAETPWTAWDDRGRTCLPQPGNPEQMRNYVEEYDYDSAGNLEQIRHSACCGGNTYQNKWTRTLTIEPEKYDPLRKKSNRLVACSVLGETGTFTYDAHGNMTSMPHLPGMAPRIPGMTLDFKNQLQRVCKSGGNDPDLGTKVYFTYDAGGQRVRKVVEQDGRRLKERFYIGSYEVYRKYSGAGTVTALERESLHVMDDKQRVALVDTRTIDTKDTESGLPETLIRYQLGNHLGSMALELDENADPVSYEEYYPYGSTSYQAARSDTPGGVKTSAKRYRYIGKERDGETGLYYCGARYYAPWLGRWTSCDPGGIMDTLNVYEAMRNNPVRFFDKSGFAAGDEESDQPVAGQTPNKPLIGYYASLMAERKAAGMMSYAKKMEYRNFWRSVYGVGKQREAAMAKFVESLPGVKRTITQSFYKDPVTLKTVDLGPPTTDPDKFVKTRCVDVAVEMENAPGKALVIETSSRTQFSTEGKELQMMRDEEAVARHLVVGDEKRGYLEATGTVKQSELVGVSAEDAARVLDAKVPSSGTTPATSTGAGSKAEPLPKDLFEPKPVPRSTGARVLKGAGGALKLAAEAAGPAMLILQVMEPSPDVYHYDESDEELVYFFGQVKSLFTGVNPPKPPHMGGDPCLFPKTKHLCGP